MIRIKQISLGVVLIFLFWQNSVYDYSVPDINGGNQALSAYQGKKILIVTLPVTQDPAADTMLYCLDTLASAHLSDLKIVATPAYEDGFTPTQKEQLKQWYQGKLGSYILITDGLYTRKTSGSQQHDLFKWLTMENQNEVFDIDVDGPNYKFFANTIGKLYGVIRPQSKISGAAVQRTLREQ